MPQSPFFVAIILCTSFLVLSVSEQQQYPQLHAKSHKNKWSTMAREFLAAHNKVRKHFKEPPLKWDKKLARYARRWAAKRYFDCKMIHSYGPYGENIFWGKRAHWTPKEAVQSWVREHKYYNAHSNGCAEGQMCGHYTQIVWRETSRIGCARKKCQNKGLFVICVYDPPGNYINENPFGPLNTFKPTAITTSSPSTTTPTTPIA